MEDLKMRSAMLTLAAVVLSAAVGCDKGSTPDEKKGVEVKAPGVEVNTGDKAPGGGVEVKTPGAEVDVNKKTDN
jgi:hypothetical protein